MGGGASTKTQNRQAEEIKREEAYTPWIRECSRTGVSMHNVDDMTEQDIKYLLVATCKRCMNVNGMRQTNKGRTAFMGFDTEQTAEDVFF